MANHPPEQQAHRPGDPTGWFKTPFLREPKVARSGVGMWEVGLRISTSSGVAVLFLKAPHPRTQGEGTPTAQLPRPRRFPEGAHSRSRTRTRLDLQAPTRETWQRKPHLLGLVSDQTVPHAALPLLLPLLCPWDGQAAVLLAKTQVSAGTLSCGSPFGLDHGQKGRTWPGDHPGSQVVIEGDTR